MRTNKKLRPIDAVVDETYSLSEIAARLGCSAASLRRLSALGRFPVIVRVTGGNQRVRAAAFERWWKKVGGKR